MIFVHGRFDSPGIDATGTTFTGQVLIDPIVPAHVTEQVLINTVNFAPGARTFWHVHEAAQILHVLAGRGRIANRDGDHETLRAGDVVYIPAGEEHWHGADPDTYMVHTAISIGGIDWLVAVTDDEYAQGFADA